MGEHHLQQFHSSHTHTLFYLALASVSDIYIMCGDVSFSRHLSGYSAEVRMVYSIAFDKR